MNCAVEQVIKVLNNFKAFHPEQILACQQSLGV